MNYKGAQRRATNSIEATVLRASLNGPLYSHLRRPQGLGLWRGYFGVPLLSYKGLCKPSTLSHLISPVRAKGLAHPDPLILLSYGFSGLGYRGTGSGSSLCFRVRNAKSPDLQDIRGGMRTSKYAWTFQVGILRVLGFRI